MPRLDHWNLAVALPSVEAEVAVVLCSTGHAAQPSNVLLGKLDLGHARAQESLAHVCQGWARERMKERTAKIGRKLAELIQLMASMTSDSFIPTTGHVR